MLVQAAVEITGHMSVWANIRRGGGVCPAIHHPVGSRHGPATKGRDGTSAGRIITGAIPPSVGVASCTGFCSE